MMDEKRLQELREEWSHYELGPADITIDEVFSSIESLLKIARAAQWLSNRLHTDGGTLPGEIDNLDEALSVLPTVEDKEPGK